MNSRRLGNCEKKDGIYLTVVLGADSQEKSPELCRERQAVSLFISNPVQGDEQ